MKFWRALGPGVLFAGAAIGTSHLVQSTRAGALFGLGFLGIIIFANLIKYPAFSFGPAYTAATGESLIDGYARLGKWVVAVVSLGLLLVQAIIINTNANRPQGLGNVILGRILFSAHLEQEVSSQVFHPIFSLLIFCL